MSRIKYLSTTEYGHRLGISRRRVTKLCTDHRIPGTLFVSNHHLIPETAADVRYAHGTHPSRKWKHGGTGK